MIDFLPKKWHIKAIAQKVISVLPFSFRINYFFQRYVTRRVLLTDDFLSTMLEHHREAVHYWKIHGADVNNARIIELGTGWHPVIPVLHYLLGAREVVTIDLRPLIRKKNLRMLLRQLLQWHDAQSADRDLEDWMPDRIDVLRDLLWKWKELTLDQILQSLQIRQWIGDVQHTGLPDNSFDLCTSVNVLEHVNADHVSTIMAELGRLTKPAGLHYHAIGTYDHFVHVDTTISKFNYLKYSKAQWQRIDNAIQPQNRLRLSYFKEIFELLGLVITEVLLWDAEPEEIAKIKVHADFAGLEWLDVPYGTFVLRKK